MKRFVTYLYECQRGNKSKNVGFIRVNVRDKKTTMEVYIRNITRVEDTGKLFALIYREKLHGIELGEVLIRNGQGDCEIQVQTENIAERSFSLTDIEGVGICLDGGCYIASCWKDEYADEIVRGEFLKETEEVRNTLIAAEDTAVNDNQEMAYHKDVVFQDEISWKGQEPTYEKIDLSQIRELPSPNWHLATNSFLVHGFWNYGYLVVKKSFEEGKKILSLGVPGIYEKPEAVMAVLFGFPDFEPIPWEEIEMQKNQESKDGTFGCWFVSLKI